MAVVMHAKRQQLEEWYPNERSVTPPVSPQLLCAARDGDQRAFAQLVRAYYPRCLRFARYVVGNPADAEECVQDTFVRVHRALHRYEERDRFNSWLFRILANRCRTTRHRIRWRQAQSLAFAFGRSVESTVTDDFEAQEALSKALAALPDDQREAFLLRHVEGLAYDQIAAVTGVAITAVRMRVSRAGARLRDAVARIQA